MTAPLLPSSRKPCASITPTRKSSVQPGKRLGLHISAEHADTREYISAEVEKQLAPLKRDAEDLRRRARGEIPERREDQTAAQRRDELDKALAQLPALRQERRRRAELIREEARAGKVQRKDAAQQATTEGIPQAALIAAPDLDHCFRKSFVPAELSERIWNYILHDTSPYHVNLRKGAGKTRPKVNFSIARREGAYKIFSCYRWGQHEEDWTLIEEPPACILELAQLAEREFGMEAGHLNNMMLTFYFNGKDQHLPNHQDKAVDFKSEGKIENTSKIFNFSFGAPRAFVVTGLDSLGTSKREEMPTVHGEFIMEFGDLFVLEPETNASCAHGVPYDESADNLRVSLVLRHVSKHEVRVLADDAAAPWEVRTRKTSGTWSKWESVKAPKQGEPTDQEDRLRHRRGQAARIFQRQELNAKETKLLREELRKLGLVTQGKRNELIERLLDSPCSTDQAL